MIFTALSRLTKENIIIKKTLRKKSGAFFFMGGSKN